MRRAQCTIGALMRQSSLAIAGGGQPAAAWYFRLVRRKTIDEELKTTDSGAAENEESITPKRRNCGTIQALQTALERARRNDMRDDITNIAIDDYLLDLMPPRSEIFRELEKRAHDRGLPLVGPVQGQFLYLLAKSMDACEALEIGTVTGYAAMWLMRAVAPAGGRVTAIERDSERFKLAKDYLTRAGYADQLVIHQGEWFSVLESIDGPFDLIFLDILRNLSD